MITKDTFEDINFEKLSKTAQYTYWVASLYADDEGYLKLTELKFRSNCTSLDTDALQAGNFMEIRGEICYLLNWENEQSIKNDRFKESVLKQHFSGEEPQRIQTGSKMESQNRVDKISINAHFDKFWSKYPRKKSKKKANDIYSRLLSKSKDPDKLHLQIMMGLKKYCDELERKGTASEYILHPTTWLNQERWEDEADKAKDAYSDYQKLG